MALSDEDAVSPVTDLPTLPPLDDDEDQQALQPHLKLPLSQWVPASAVNKHLFKPERGSRPMPPEMMAILRPPLLPTLPTSPPKPVELQCRFNRMFVRIRRDLFGLPNADHDLSFGSCQVNKMTPTHFYFLYDVKSCGTQLKYLADGVVYSNVLKYRPVISGPIVRAWPFTLPMECTYHRFHHSYKVGFHPCPKRRTHFKSLATPSGVALTHLDANWERHRIDDSYTLGEAMHFEARIPHNAEDERAYVNTCYITSLRDPNTKPRFTVIENFGCMVDSVKSPQSKFVPYPRKNVVRFTIGSFLFQEMITHPMSPKRLYLHCEIVVGGPTATPSTKSCTYNSTTAMWQELFDKHGACSCCTSKCPAPPTASAVKMVTSRPWSLAYDKSDLQTVAEKDIRAYKALGPIAPSRSVFEHIWDIE